MTKYLFTRSVIAVVGMMHSDVASPQKPGLYFYLILHALIYFLSFFFPSLLFFRSVSFSLSSASTVLCSRILFGTNDTIETA